MNEIKYEILKLLDTSDKLFTGYEILECFQKLDYKVADVEKHFFDLCRLGYTDSGTHQDIVNVTVQGRKYIDDYEYRKECDNLYKQQLADTKRTAQRSFAVAVISAVIALIATASDIVATIIAN